MKAAIASLLLSSGCSLFADNLLNNLAALNEKSPKCLL